MGIGLELRLRPYRRDIWIERRLKYLTQEHQRLGGGAIGTIISTAFWLAIPSFGRPGIVAIGFKRGWPLGCFSSGLASLKGSYHECHQKN